MPDRLSQTYVQIWALLEANRSFAGLVQANNRIKLFGPKLNPQKDNKGESDFPEVILSMGGYSGEMFTHTPTFAAMNAGTNVNSFDWIEKHNQTYVLTITGQDTAVDRVNPITQAIEAALRAGGPRLGLTDLCRWGPMTAPADQDTKKPTGLADPGGVMRLVRVISLPVEFRFHGSDA